MRKDSTNGGKTVKSDGTLESQIVGFFASIEGQKKQVVLTFENRKLTLGLLGTTHNKKRKGEEFTIEVGDTVSATEILRLFAAKE